MFVKCNFVNFKVSKMLPYSEERKLWSITQIRVLRLTLSLEDVPPRLLPATLSVSDAICCTMVLFGTVPSWRDLSRSATDLLDFFFPFFFPTFFGMTNGNNLDELRACISIKISAYYKWCIVAHIKDGKVTCPPYCLLRCHDLSSTQFSSSSCQSATVQAIRSIYTEVFQ